MFPKNQNVEVQDEVAKLLMGEGFKIPVTLPQKSQVFYKSRKDYFWNQARISRKWRNTPTRTSGKHGHVLGKLPEWSDWSMKDNPPAMNDGCFHNQNAATHETCFMPTFPLSSYPTTNILKVQLESIYTRVEFSRGESILKASETIHNWNVCLSIIHPATENQSLF